MTFRMRGHEEASGTKYVPKEKFEEWNQKDPLKNFERFLIDEKVLTEITVADIRNEFKAEIDASLNPSEGGTSEAFNIDEEFKDVYAPISKFTKKIKDVDFPPSGDRGLKFFDAIKEGLLQSMQQHPNLILMGQDIAEYGGAFKSFG